jgi:hypothetical protein
MTAPPEARQAPDSDTSRSWNVGKTLAVAGAAIGVAGTTWAVVHAIGFHNQKVEHERLQGIAAGCGDKSDPCAAGSQRYEKAARADAQARGVREDASRALYRSVAGAMVGGSGFLVGAVFWFTLGQQQSEPRAASAVRIQPLAGSRCTGFNVSGSW